MKYLFINEVFYPDVASTAQHLTDLALELSKAGHQVTVLASRRNYNNPDALFPPKEDYQGVRIIRTASWFYSRKTRLLRFLSAAFLQLSFLWKLMFEISRESFDAVIGMTSPPLVGYLSAMYAKLKKSKFIYWVMDVNPDEAIEAGWIRKDSFKAKVLNRLLIWTLQNADQIIVLDEYMNDRLVQKGAEPQKIMVCPPWAHTDHLQTIPHADNPFRKKHGLENKFVVMYSGNHSICHPLDTLLEAAHLLRSQTDIVFVFIGGGERVRDVLKFKEEKGLSNIIQLPYEPLSEIRYSLSAANLHVVVMGNGYNGIVHPSKIYGILSLGRPFLYIGPEKSAIGAIIEQGTGFEVKYGEREKVADIIADVKAWTPQETKQKEFVEKQIAENFTKQVLVARMIHLLTGDDDAAV